jgi:hypothetical protein
VLNVTVKQSGCTTKLLTARCDPPFLFSTQKELVEMYAETAVLELVVGYNMHILASKNKQMSGQKHGRACSPAKHHASFTLAEKRPSNCLGRRYTHRAGGPDTRPVCRARGHRANNGVSNQHGSHIWGSRSLTKATDDERRGDGGGPRPGAATYIRVI